MRKRFWVVGLWLAAFAWLAPTVAEAFCGFYVAGADTKLFNDATMVVLFRDGTRTVLSMQNDYEGPPEAFALVVPVPVVLEEDQVKTLSDDVFSRVDELGAPRLVEYWEGDPCEVTNRGEGIGLGSIGTMGFGSGTGRRSRETVTVEAEFAVGEYQIVILSAGDAGDLDRWLRDAGYHIPEGAEPLFRPYVQEGSKFFVAKVDPQKVTFDNGRARLSPLRFHFDSERFSLPVRLGLINAKGKQDLIVNILARDRYQVANYPNAFIPTNLDLAPAAKERFGATYLALFEDTVKKKAGMVVTEYAWQASSCDPCPRDPLSDPDIATLGADVAPSFVGAQVKLSPRLRFRGTEVSGGGYLPKEVVQRIVRQNYGRLRLCREAAPIAADAKETVTFRFAIGAEGKVSGTTIEAPGVTGATWPRCMQQAMAGLSFPQPEKGPMKAEVTFEITAAPVGMQSMGSELVLTRLHTRYDAASLSEDLVFEKAPAVRGGRERYDDGKLEQGAAPADMNNFQARYAIRHAWEGAVACETPVRGRWGGPPQGVSPTPVAFAGRLGNQRQVGSLADLTGLTSEAPGPSASPASSATAAPATSAVPETGAGSGSCGCELAPRPASPWAVWLGVGLLGLSFRRRRRQRSPLPPRRGGCRSPRHEALRVDRSRRPPRHRL
ncbi:MAG: DUF2330 domain-containing protein [Myxococcales bacterium]|nr:DUF2330 domain-containing protein [Myxococcales bacterium]